MRHKHSKILLGPRDALATDRSSRCARRNETFSAGTKDMQLTSYISATFEYLFSAGRPLLAWFHEALLSCNEPFYALILY